MAENEDNGMDNVISVIVPVYNVETYLPQCLDSILGQDHDALEVILIDDGSTDASGKICDEYLEKDGRIRVIHQKNGGAASAKNAGLRAATGEYLSFVDSDDYLEPEVYGYMVGKLKESGADAAQFSFRDVYRTRTEEHILQPGEGIMGGKEYLVRFTKDWTCALLWNKLYRRSLFHDIFFEEGHKIDDEYFTYQGILNAKRVVFDEKTVYNYRRRASSVMLSPRSREQMALDRVDFLSKRREKVIARFPELRRPFDIQFLDALIYLSEDENNSPESIAMLKAQLKAYLKTPGNTMPPKYFWRGLLKLYVTDTKRLLAESAKNAVREDVSDCFP